jgi:hypothetical protein
MQTKKNKITAEDIAKDRFLTSRHGAVKCSCFLP